MQIAQVLAGYSLGRRRPAAPRDGEEEGRSHGRRSAAGFVEGCARNGVPDKVANEIFDLMEQVRGLRL